MKLSRRLEKLVEMAPRVHTTADIGTDHGYVPCALLKENKADFVIASDINQKPLEKAVTMSERMGCRDRISFRKGAGLEVLGPGEAQGAIIAGMGGEMIREILLASPDRVKEMSYLILQPAQNPEIVRRYVYGGGYTILSEDLVQEEDGRFYEYFKVAYNEEILGFSHDPMEFVLSPVLLKKRHPLMRAFLTEKIREIQLIRSKIDMSYPSSREKDQELEQERQYFEEALKWL